MNLSIDVLNDFWVGFFNHLGSTMFLVLFVLYLLLSFIKLADIANELYLYMCT